MSDDEPRFRVVRTKSRSGRELFELWIDGRPFGRLYGHVKAVQAAKRLGVQLEENAESG